MPMMRAAATLIDDIRCGGVALEAAREAEVTPHTFSLFAYAFQVPL